MRALTAPISASTSGNTAVVAAHAGQTITVVSILVIAAGTVGVKFQSGTTDITGSLPLVANSGFTQVSSMGVFKTSVSEALNINLDANVAVGGFLSYILD